LKGNSKLGLRIVILGCEEQLKPYREARLYVNEPWPDIDLIALVERLRHAPDLNLKK
jgi:hypothetical protein